MIMIAKWIIVFWLALGTLLTIASIGKPRKPLEASQVAVMTVFNVAIITAIVMWWEVPA